MALVPNRSLFHVLNVNRVPCKLFPLLLSSRISHKKSYIYTALFSLFLTPKSVGDAELTIGGIDQSKVNGTLTFAPVGLPPPPGGGVEWTLNSSNIAVNGQTTSLLSKPLNIIFDSGTSNLVFQPNITQVRSATTEFFYLKVDEP